MAHEEGRDPEWATAFTPFSVDLYDAVQTADGPYAVGGGGTVAHKREEGWEALIDGGPAGQGRKLRTIATTDDGRRVWFAGSSGALGMYDLRHGEKQDYSYTGDATTSWREVAVTGEAGEERALLANGSGAVVSFEVEGAEVAFSEPTEPGQGDAVNALTTTSDGVGYAVDGAGVAYRANPEGWTSLGTVNASATLTDVYADNSGRLLVAATDGKLYRYDRPEETWTPIDVARSALEAVDVFQGHIVALATGATFYSRPIDGELRWHRAQAETGNNLVGLALGYPDVAVGKSGTIIERPRGRPPKAGKGEEEKREAAPEDPVPPAPPTDPCRVLTEEMVERLGGGELLTLVEEFGCTDAFTESVAERFELSHLVERTCRRPLREVPPELRTRIRESESYRLCCACCHKRVPIAPGCTCGAECSCQPPEAEAPERLLCERCGHAAFIVSQGPCGPAEPHDPCEEPEQVDHIHYHDCGGRRAESRHEHAHRECCGGHHSEKSHHDHHECCGGHHGGRTHHSHDHHECCGGIHEETGHHGHGCNCGR